MVIPRNSSGVGYGAGSLRSEAGSWKNRKGFSRIDFGFSFFRLYTLLYTFFSHVHLILPHDFHGHRNDFFEKKIESPPFFVGLYKKAQTILSSFSFTESLPNNEMAAALMQAISSFYTKYKAFRKTAVCFCFLMQNLVLPTTLTRCTFYTNAIIICC